MAWKQDCHLDSNIWGHWESCHGRICGCSWNEIIVFYPKDGVSKVQELQMTTQTGDNTHVIAIDGNFDECPNQCETYVQ